MDIELQYIWFRMSMTVVAAFGILYSVKHDNYELRYFCVSILLIGMIARIVGWLL